MQDSPMFFTTLVLGEEVTARRDVVNGAEHLGISYIFTRVGNPQRLVLRLGDFVGEVEELRALEEIVNALNSALALSNRKLVLARTLDENHDLVGKERWASFHEHDQYMQNYPEAADKFREVEFYILEFQQLKPS